MFSVSIFGLIPKVSETLLAVTGAALGSRLNTEQTTTKNYVLHKTIKEVHQVRGTRMDCIVSDCGSKTNLWPEIRCCSNASMHSSSESSLRGISTTMREGNGNSDV